MFPSGGRNRFIVNGTIPDPPAPKDNMPVTNGIQSKPATGSATEPAPKLSIPLKEQNHPRAYFQEEREGWHGYIEWERYPEKRKVAADVLSKYAFAEVARPS